MYNPPNPRDKYEINTGSLSYLELPSNYLELPGRKQASKAGWVT
jgi:hypothetical protein